MKISPHYIHTVKFFSIGFSRHEIPRLPSRLDSLVLFEGLLIQLDFCNHFFSILEVIGLHIVSINVDVVRDRTNGLPAEVVGTQHPVAIVEVLVKWSTKYCSQKVLDLE
jgi:hypothetical protein